MDLASINVCIGLASVVLIVVFMIMIMREFRRIRTSLRAHLNNNSWYGNSKVITINPRVEAIGSIKDPYVEKIMEGRI